MRYCSNCGNPIADDANFCPKCGTSQAIGAGQPPRNPYEYQAGAQGSQGPFQQSFGQGQPPFGAFQQQATPSASGKNYLAAGILALLLGGIGIHYFYSGKTKGGIICILLTICTCGVWDIISFIQGIIILCGTQREYEEKYVFTYKDFPIF